jgi:cation transport protein ChaC
MVPANQSFWVFGYGSLMWRTGFPYTKKARVKLLGYHRALCIESWHHRGTRDMPGVVFGLDEGGMCEGLAFLVEPEHRAEVLSYLYDRELISYCYQPMRLPMQFESGEQCFALSFVANPQDQQYLAPKPINELVDIINRARGQSGANRDYVCNTWSHLQDIGISDCWLEEIVNEVEINGSFNC